MGHRPRMRQPISRAKSTTGWMASSKIPISPRTIASVIT
jgi:hypothetical protein